MAAGEALGALPRWRFRQVRWSFLVSLCLALTHLGTATAWAQPLGRSVDAGPAQGFAELVERVAPAVVNISTRRTQETALENFPMPQVPPGSPFEDFFRDFFDRDRPQGPQAPRRNFALGSGFVVDPEGYVVTNNHVIAEADEISVIFNDDSEYSAQLVGTDTKTDLALLKIENGGDPFPYLEWADSDQIRVGDWMVAIGNPFGLGSTVTAGIVSARGRDIRAGPYDDFIQVDAAINRGNSGGPSFAMDGRVLGVNTAIFSPSGGNVGIGFAIPANMARPIIESIKDTGRVRRGWLGVRIQSVTEEIADSLGLPQSDGALVASVTPDGPAAEAGIEAGDVILEFDGQTVDRMRSLPRIVAETPVGNDVQVKIWRRGDTHTRSVELGELPDDEELAQMSDRGGVGPDSATRVAELGLTVGPITGEARELYALPEDVTGVVVTEVDPEGPAAAEDVRPGDIIKEVGQEEVNSPPEFLAKIRGLQDADKRAALLLVDRAGDGRFVALRFRQG